MDVSKLPKLSPTPPNPEQTSPDPDRRDPDRRDPEPRDPNPPDRHPEPVAIGGEAWISILIGGIVLFMQQRFLLWLAGRGAPWVDAQGNPIPYSQTLYFIHDLGLFAFGVALVLDGLLLLVCRPWALVIGLSVTLLATLLNLLTCVRTMSMGPQWLPILALVFGIYIALYQWKVLRLLTSGRSAPMT